MFKILSIAFFITSLLNCRTTEYQYYLMQTTGHCKYMLTESNKLIPIVFSAKSNPEAVKSLEALNYGIFQMLADKYNGNGNKIFMRGELSSQVKWKPFALIMDGDKILPESYEKKNMEEYYEFTLDSWFIIVPFEEYISMGPPEYKIINHDKLNYDDFDVDITKDIIDLNQLQHHK
jgi:hypothetical protein